MCALESLMKNKNENEYNMGPLTVKKGCMF